MVEKINIVIADDEAHIRELLTVLAHSIGYRVIGQAEDGVQAVEVYRKMQPDVLLLDINMPNMGGVDVLDEVMKINPSAVVIMLTSLNSLDIVRQCLAGGAKHYLLKDKSIDNMREMLKGAILKNIELIENNQGSKEGGNAMLSR